MTVDTCEIFYLVNYHHCSIFLRELVTGTTLHLCMTPFQGEISGAVIELFRHPTAGNMATGTFGYAIDGEGVVVYIFMTGDTGSVQAIELLHEVPAIVGHLKVAVPAVYFQVLAVQRPFRPGMVKVYCGPGFTGMTEGTVLVGVELLRNVALVNVLMTVHTSGAQFAEGPSFIVFTDMAGKTGRSQVCAFQRKGGGLMLFEGVQTIVKAMLERMTLDTIRADIGFGELAFVIILMAVATGRKIDRC